MRHFLQLETVIRRAPLGMRFVDIIRDETVSDALLVQVWHYGTTGPKQIALTSPISGVYGFRSLPGLVRYEVGERPASAWCGPSSGLMPPDDWASSGALYGWVSADGSPVTANFVVTVEDLQGRYLPEMLLLCLPREKLLEVPLFSSPARPPLAGLGVIRGQLVRHDGAQAGNPAGWARVTAVLGERTYEALADARGIFVLFVPYARFPALQNGGAPRGSEPIERLVWDVTIRVLYQPSKHIFVSGVEQPEIRSLIEQGQANVYQQMDQSLPELETQLPFGRDLLVTTEGQKSLLFVDPALP